DRARLKCVKADGIVLVAKEWVLDLLSSATIGTDPPRLARLSPTSRAITCVVLEHAMVSYSSLWQGGRHVWQIRHTCECLFGRGLHPLRRVEKQHKRLIRPEQTLHISNRSMDFILIHRSISAWRRIIAKSAI